ncbi:MAG: efflux RND transporter permease subunit [Gammaproteobacteria bacterium]
MLGRIIDIFLRGNITPFIVVVSLIVGVVAILVTPSEEEPQIVVPMADVFVSAPGLPVEEVERQVVTPLEKLLHQIDGIEHVYSTSLPGSAVVTVRFYVGEDREESIVKIYNKISSNTGLVPSDVASLCGQAGRDRRRADCHRHAVERSALRDRRPPAAVDCRAARNRPASAAGDEPHVCPWRSPAGGPRLARPAGARRAADLRLDRSGEECVHPLVDLF